MKGNILFLILISFQYQVNGADQFFVDPRVRTLDVPFEGWGTSLAWFADILGGLEPEVIDEITDAFFSPEKLNLNIVRYVIGGTTPWNYTCGPYRDGAGSESFLDGPEYEYDWTRDPRQRLILEKAKALGVDTFEAFSNSPPQWMTISGCTKGNPGGGILHGNFDAVNARIFADYLTNVIQYFHENLGITFQYIAPFNEPMGLGGVGGWMGPPVTSQEGCNMDHETMSIVVETLYEVIQEKNMNYLTISTADETQINTAISTQEYFHRKGLAEKISKVNVHGYWDLAIPAQKRDFLYMLTQKNDQILWMDEMGWAGTPKEDMTQGLEITRRIITNLKYMLPSAWIYWQILEGGGGWGLITLPYDDPKPENIRYNSGYFSMLQFSHYIKKGYFLIQINSDNAIAAYDEVSKSLVIVMINSEIFSLDVQINLGAFSSLGEVTAIRTSSTEQNALIGDVNIDGSFKLNGHIPPESITTFVIQNAEFTSDGINRNLLKNSDFEDETDNSWILDIESDTKVANDKYVFRGEFSGHVQITNTSISSLTLSQTVIAEESGTYFLTAWANTYGFTSYIRVEIGEETDTEMQITIKTGGYRAYSLQFEATQGQAIKIGVNVVRSYSPVDIIEAFIDDASLHFCAHCTNGSNSLLNNFTLLFISSFLTLKSLF